MHNTSDTQTSNIDSTHTLNTNKTSNADLSEVFDLYDFEPLAKQRLDKGVFAYISTGSGNQRTFTSNNEAFDNIKLNPKLLNNAKQIDTSITLFGQKMDYPIMVDPFAFHKIMHHDGELAAVTGAGRQNTSCVISSFTTTPLEEIQKVATQPIWFQLYVQEDKAFAKEMLKKAEEVGCKAVCITVDAFDPVTRTEQLKSHFEEPDKSKVPYLKTQPVPITWEEIKTLIESTTLPVLIKGIMNPEDAEMAINIGAAGIIVSNHGGRKLDTSPPTIEALPRVVERVANRVPVLLDGGIRRGNDVIKALALGADAVLLGKPIAFALAAAGADGVAKALSLLEKEL